MEITKEQKVKLIINEVDCYIGNKNNWSVCATDRATQHQFMLKENNKEYYIGRRNIVSDDDRYERVVFELEVNKEVADLWKKCIKPFKSENCQNNKKFNNELRKEIDFLLGEIHNMIDIVIPIKKFKTLSFY